MRMKMILSGALAVMFVAACGQASEPQQAAAPAQNLVEPAEEGPAQVPEIIPNEAPLPSGHPNSIQPETTLNISATGSVQAEPDIAFVTAGVQSEAKTAKDAMAQNSAAMNGVFTALKQANIADKDMQTSNFSLSPKYNYSSRSNNESPRITGYTASNQVTVKVRDLENLGTTMDTLVEAGGNTFSGLRFGLNDDKAVKDEARALAMAEAMSRAKIYADAAGYEVARIVTLSESGGARPQPMMEMARMRSADVATSIASGEVGYNITVNVMFELRKAE